LRDPVKTWQEGWELTCEPEGGFQRLTDWFSLASWDLEGIFGKGLVAGSRGAISYWDLYMREAGKGASKLLKVVSKVSGIVTIEATIFDLACRPFD
jgi:hypothetical protein